MADSAGIKMVAHDFLCIMHVFAVQLPAIVMDSEDLQSFQEWFSAYCNSFLMPVAEDQRNILLKQAHTREVCQNAARIARDLRMDPQASALAETTALFHDVGRFPQYAQYKTFDDSISANHAALGTKALLQNKVLEKSAKHDRDIIIRSVALHNVFSLPANLDEETRLFAELVRDADKLDILRLFIEYFEQDEKSRAGAVALGLPDTPGYSQEIMSCLKKGAMALKAMLRNQNDFKLLQLTWIFDLNFVCSFRMLVERDLIARLSEKLPGTVQVAQAVDFVCGYVDKKLRNH